MLNKVTKMPYKLEIFNLKNMETIRKSSALLSLFLVLTSFAWTNDNLKTVVAVNGIPAELTITKDEVIITYDNSDVCGLKYLGEVKVTEKKWFSHNGTLKEETVTELKKLTSEKGGNIVFVDIQRKKGYGIFFSTTIVGYVYEK
jgi:hypothetical protein